MATRHPTLTEVHIITYRISVAIISVGLPETIAELMEK